ncbi:hypothetical protein SpCBS45565_g01403 [Spizellomyces sp. 'palustris']|nr:hypothetical protein SpCBS45565_g01403 [Spizellomyces sp. 'palustris']
MWKSTTGQPIQPTPSVEDDWDSDPTFINDVSEKNQRWGNQKTVERGEKELEDMEELRKKVIEQNDKKAKDEWIKQTGSGIKESYGVGKKV